MNTKLRPNAPKTIRHRSIAAAVVGFLALGAFGPTTFAQDTPFFGEVVDVRVINVEAVVSSRGERIQGLEKKDFRLLVDGKEVAIDHFAELSPAPAAESTTRGISYLVFLDDFFSLPARRDPALERLRAGIASLRPEDRMAIVAYDGRRLETLCPPTSDRLTLQRALAAAQERPAYGLQRRSEASRSFALLRQLHRTSGASFTGIGFDGSSRSRGSFDLEPIQEIFGKVQRLSVAAASALRGFQGGEGRRVLILFSGGVPISQNDVSLFQDPLRRELAPFVRAESLYADLLEAANRLGYTVYPVDLGVDSVSNLPSAEHASVFDQQRHFDSTWEKQRLNEDLLFQLADETGGLPIFDGSRVPVLGKIQEDLASYYWLGFKPTWLGDDRRHRLEIEVLRKGAKVRTRRSFADLSRAAQLDLQVESAHLFDAPLPADASFGIRAGSARPEGVGRMLVATTFEIPADQLSWAKVGEENVARIELRIAATDDNGNSAEFPREMLELRVPGEIQPGQKILHPTNLKLRRRPHRLLVTLYDPPSGRLLAQKIHVRP